MKCGISIHATTKADVKKPKKWMRDRWTDKVTKQPTYQPKRGMAIIKRRMISAEKSCLAGREREKERERERNIRKTKNKQT